MRMMLRATFPTEEANISMKGGSFPKVLEATMKKLKPEASYFMANYGCRCAMLFFDMQELFGDSCPMRTAVHGIQCRDRIAARDECR